MYFEVGERWILLWQNTNKELNFKILSNHCCETQIFLQVSCI